MLAKCAKECMYACTGARTANKHDEYKLLGPDQPRDKKDKTQTHATVKLALLMYACMQVMMRWPVVPQGTELPCLHTDC